MKKFLSSIHLVNLAVFAGQVAGAFPSNKYAMLFQTILAAVLPSFGGVGHKAFFGTSQDGQ